ncbi:MAG: tape measure protein [Methanobrevibacter sp.]|nr:tape measure protein [Methanobrevibacter sp.]
MADVILNLKYNDNGAENRINALVNTLEKAETKDWKLKINVDGPAIDRTFANIQRVGTAAIQSLKRAWGDYKSYVEAPLNLTGVNQIVSLIDKMEGSLLLNQISSNITTGFAQSLERYDILQTYPKVLENIGYSNEQASASMDKLYKSVLGLPTAFGDIVNAAQYFTLILDDLDRGTNLAIAANNAFVSSGATGQQVTAGMRQLQYIMEGTKLRSTQWYSLIRSMPLALREMGDALGYPDFKSFTEDLIANNIESELFIDTLIDVGLNSKKLGDLLESMKDRAVAALTNVKNAAMRMGEGWLTVLDETLEKTGGKGIEENIKGVSKVIDHIADVGKNWIESNGPKLQALIDKFMSIKWEDVIPKLFDSLAKIADTALDNIDKWLLEIPSILEDVKTTFNLIDNSRVIKVLEFIGKAMFGGAALGLLKGLFGGASLVGGGVGGAFASGAGIFQIFGSAIASHPAIAAASAAILGIYGIISNWDSEKEKQEHDDFLQDENTRRVVRDNIRDYVSLVRSPSSRSSGEQMYQINALRDWLFSSTGGELDLPLLDADSSEEMFLYALKLAYEYYRRDHIEPNTEIGKRLRDRGLEDILRNESAQASEHALDLYEEIVRLQSEYDNATEDYERRLSSIDERRARISAMITKLQKEGFKWEYRTSKDYINIYGDPSGKEGKFFSEKVAESFGGLFRNTLNDFGKVQEKLTPEITSLNDKMIDAITNYNGSEVDKSQLLETWASVLTGIDPSNESDVRRLQTMITEGPSKLIETYLIPMVKSNEALNRNRAIIQQAILEALGLAGSESDQEEDEVISEMVKNNRVSAIAKVLLESLEEMNDYFLPIFESGMVDVSNDIVKIIKEAIKRIDELEVVARPNINILPKVFLRSPSGEIAPADGEIGRTTRQLQRLVRQTMPLAGGGFLPMGTDTIPAMLTPGEYVQRRAAVQHFGKAFMDRINALDLNGAIRAFYSSPYSTGGFVKSDNRSYRDNHAVVNQIFNSGNASTGFRRASRFVRALV